jgi:hypothetical protein
MAIFAKERQLTPSWDLLTPSVDLLKKNLWQVIYLSFIPTLIFALGYLLLDPQHIHNDVLTMNNKDGLILMIIGGIWSLLAYPGLLYLVTQVVQGNSLSAMDAFKKGLRYVLPFIGLGILVGLAIGIGFLLIIIPGLIALRAFYLAPYYLVDQNMGPIQAMKQSARDSKPVSAWVWGVIGVTAVFSLVGGFFQHIPLVGVIVSSALSLIYLFGPVLRYGEITGRKRVVMPDKTAA